MVCTQKQFQTASARRKQAGFSLTELMVAVVIVTILGSIALPAYTSFLIRGRIPEATSALATARVDMEQFFQDHRTYTGASYCSASDTSRKYFDLIANNCSDTGFQLSAAGKGAMTGFSYFVDQANAQSSTVTGVSEWSGNNACWVTAPGGQC